MNWAQQYNESGKVFKAVYFIDSNYGWATGLNGTILHTEDGGETWELQESNSPFELNSVYFVDHTNGWIVGGGVSFYGIILNTTNGGSDWELSNFSTMPPCTRCILLIKIMVGL